MFSLAFCQLRTDTEIILNCEQSDFLSLVCVCVIGLVFLIYVLDFFSASNSCSYNITVTEPNPN